jgi:hypothetical protein
MAYIPDTLTDDSVSNPNFFKEDLIALTKEIATLEELCKRIDSDLQGLYFNKDRGQITGRGVLTFVSKQLETLAGLRGKKYDALAQVAQFKHKIAQLSITKRKSEEKITDSSALSREFQKILMAHRQELTATAQYITPSTSQDDALIDNHIKKLEEEGSLVFSESEKTIQYEHESIVIKIMLKPQPHFIAYDEAKGVVIANYPESLFPDKSILTDTTKIINGRLYYGAESYEIVDFKQK